MFCHVTHSVVFHPAPCDKQHRTPRLHKRRTTAVVMATGAESVPHATSSQKHGKQYYVVNLVHIAFAFFLVFTAFSGIQVLCSFVRK